MPDVEMTKIDPKEDPFVLLVGGVVGTGELGSDESEEQVHVVVNEIHYIPWNDEHGMPRTMRLVVPSELAAEIGNALIKAAELVPTAHDQAVSFLNRDKENDK